MTSHAAPQVSIALDFSALTGIFTCPSCGYTGHPGDFATWILGGQHSSEVVCARVLRGHRYHGCLGMLMSAIEGPRRRRGAGISPLSPQGPWAQALE